MTDGPLPIFTEYLLDFGDSEIPQHIDEYPEMPNHVGMFAVFSWAGGNKAFPVAQDIATLELARTIAEAKVRKMEADKSLYGYTLDVYIDFPNGEQERVYYGDFT